MTSPIPVSTCEAEAGPMGPCPYHWLKEGHIWNARVCIFCEYNKIFSLPVHSNSEFG